MRKRLTKKDYPKSIDCHGTKISFDECYRRVVEENCGDPEGCLGWWEIQSFIWDEIENKND